MVAWVLVAGFQTADVVAEGRGEVLNPSSEAIVSLQHQARDP